MTRAKKEELSLENFTHTMTTRSVRPFSLTLSSPPSPASSPSFLARSLESISLSEASRPRAADWEGVVQVNRVLVAEYVSEEWSEA